MVVELEIEIFPSLVSITPKGNGNFIQKNRTLSGHRHVAFHVQVKGLRKEGPIFGKSKWGFHQPKSCFIPAQGNMGMGPAMGWKTWWRDEHTTAILVGNPGCQEFDMAIFKSLDRAAIESSTLNYGILQKSSKVGSSKLLGRKISWIHSCTMN